MESVFFEASGISRPDMNHPDMGTTAIKAKQAAKDLPVQAMKEKKEIPENYFNKKILGKQEHEFILRREDGCGSGTAPQEGEGPLNPN